MHRFTRRSALKKADTLHILNGIFNNPLSLIYIGQQLHSLSCGMISAESDVQRCCFFAYQPGRQCLLLELAAWIIRHIPLTQVLHPPVQHTSKRAAGVNAYCARLRSAYDPQDKPFPSGSKNH